LTPFLKIALVVFRMCVPHLGGGATGGSACGTVVAALAFVGTPTGAEWRTDVHYQDQDVRPAVYGGLAGLGRKRPRRTGLAAFVGLRRIGSRMPPVRWGTALAHRRANSGPRRGRLVLVLLVPRPGVMRWQKNCVMAWSDSLGPDAHYQQYLLPRHK
jgi:hypothetical protein